LLRTESGNVTSLNPVGDTGRADDPDPGPGQDPTDVQGRVPRADVHDLPRVDEKGHILGLADAIPGHAPSPAIDSSAPRPAELICPGPLGEGLKLY